MVRGHLGVCKEADKAQITQYYHVKDFEYSWSAMWSQWKDLIEVTFSEDQS